MPTWFPVLRYVYQHGKWVAGSACSPGLISTRATGDARAGSVLPRVGGDSGRAATAPVGLPGAAAAQTRPHGSAGLGARPGWAVQRRSRGRPRPRGPGRAKWAQNGFVGISGAEQGRVKAIRGVLGTFWDPCGVLEVCGVNFDKFPKVRFL